MNRSIFKAKSHPLVKWATEKPNRLFLIDGLGALLSAFLLGIVLVRLEPTFGIPVHILYFLATLPLLFGIYDLLCYHFAKTKVGTFLKAIALMNLGYGILSLSLASLHFRELTVWGWSYILVEVVVIYLLAMVEWRVASLPQLDPGGRN